MKEYFKTITLTAKLFEKGDEDGYNTRYYDDEDVDPDGCIHTSGLMGEHSIECPFIHNGKFEVLSRGYGREYLCTFSDGSKQLIEKEQFEKEYFEVNALN